MNYYKRKEQENRWRWCLGTLAVFAVFMFLLWGCASTGVVRERPTTLYQEEARERCELRGPCFAIWATNPHFEQYDLFVNGELIGQVEGYTFTAVALWAHESQLRDGRCATVRVRSRLAAIDVTSERQCIDVGGKFTLDLNQNWFVIWTGWQSWQRI